MFFFHPPFVKMLLMRKGKVLLNLSSHPVNQHTMFNIILRPAAAVLISCMSDKMCLVVLKSNCSRNCGCRIFMLKLSKRDVVPRRSHIQDQLLVLPWKLFRRRELRNPRFAMLPGKQLFGIVFPNWLLYASWMGKTLSYLGTFYSLLFLIDLIGMFITCENQF